MSASAGARLETIRRYIFKMEKVIDGGEGPLEKETENKREEEEAVVSLSLLKGYQSDLLHEIEARLLLVNDRRREREAPAERSALDGIHLRMNVVDGCTSSVVLSQSALIASAVRRLIDELAAIKIELVLAQAAAVSANKAPLVRDCASTSSSSSSETQPLAAVLTTADSLSQNITTEIDQRIVHEVDVERLKEAEAVISELEAALATKEADSERLKEAFAFKLRELEAQGIREIQHVQQQMLATHSAELEGLAQELSSLLSLLDSADHLASTALRPVDLIAGLSEKIRFLVQSSGISRAQVSERCGHLLETAPLERVVAEDRMAHSDEKIARLQSRISALQGSIAELELQVATKEPATHLPEQEKVLLAEEEEEEGEEEEEEEREDSSRKLSSQYENLTAIVSQLSEERTKAQIEMLDLQLKIDCLQSDLQEKENELQASHALLDRLRIESNASRGAVAAAEEARRQLHLSEAAFLEEKSALQSQIRVMKAMRMKKLKVASQRLAASSNEK
jgi:hypothetical protein